MASSTEGVLRHRRHATEKSIPFMDEEEARFIDVLVLLENIHVIQLSLTLA